MIDRASRATPTFAGSTRTIVRDLARDWLEILISGAAIAIFVLNEIIEDRVAGNLHVRNLDDHLIAKLKTRAARHGRSAEAEHREILKQALETEVEPSFDELAAQLRRLTARRKQTPAEVLLREGRDER